MNDETLQKYVNNFCKILTYTDSRLFIFRMQKYRQRIDTLPLGSPSDRAPSSIPLSSPCHPRPFNMFHSTSSPLSSSFFVQDHSILSFPFLLAELTLLTTLRPLFPSSQLLPSFLYLLACVQVPTVRQTHTRPLKLPERRLWTFEWTSSFEI